MDITSGGDVILPSTVTFTECSATNDEGIFILASSLSYFFTSTGPATWVSSLFGSEYDNTKDKNFVGSVSTDDEEFTFTLSHAVFTPINRGDNTMSVASTSTPAVGTEVSNCGWSDLPCLTIHTAHTHASTLNTLSIQLADGTHTAESSGVILSHLCSSVIGAQDSPTGVEKRVIEMDDPLFTMNYCETITFASIKFLIQESALSCSLFTCAHTFLTLSSISISPSTQTTPTQLASSLVVGSCGTSMSISNCTFENVTLSQGNGSAISNRIGDEFSFVVKDSQFGHCTALYGGAIYLVISADPSLIHMSGIDYISGRNSATIAGSTLFIVVKGCDKLTAEQFNSFLMSSDAQKESMVECSAGDIITLAEFLSGGGSNGSSEGDEGEKNTFFVCVWIDREAEGTGKVVVEIVEEEELSESACQVGMEEGEVVTNVGTGEKNGEEIVLSIGNELTQVLQQCETFEIAVNVSSTLYNG